MNEKSQTVKHLDGIRSQYGQHLENITKTKRISFSGRNSVREFHAEEKPKSWNYSYEVSDDINSSKSLSNNECKQRNDPKEQDVSRPTDRIETNIVKEDRSNFDLPSITMNETKCIQLYRCVSNPVGEDCKYARGARNKVISSTFEINNHSFDETWKSEKKNRRTSFNNSNTNYSIPKRLEVISSSDYDNSKDEALMESLSMTDPHKIFVNQQHPNIYSTTIYNSAKNILVDSYPKIKTHGHENADFIYKIKNVECHSDTELNMDFNRSQCELSSSNSSNFVFPPTKSSKLTPRQLNAAIENGKIVVFPENDVGQDSNFYKFSLSTKFHSHVSPVDKFQNVAHHRVKNCSSDVPIELDLTCPVDLGNKNEVTGDCDSFLVNKKTNVDISLGSNEKYADECKSENDKFLTEPVHTNELSLNQHSECNPMCIVEDISLNNTIIKDVTDYLPRGLQSDISEIKDNYSNQSMELDINAQSSSNIKKNRDTIYFNPDMEFLNIDTMLESQNDKSQSRDNVSGHSPLERNTTGSKVDIHSDSYLMDLKKTKAALSNNCERRIEGTPHRSYIEFMHLEKEVEQNSVIYLQDPNDYKYLHPNQIQPAKNKYIPVAEMERGQNHNDNNKLRKPQEAGRKMSDCPDNYVKPDASWDSNSSKRLTETPNLPLPKRRHTLVSGICTKDESIKFRDSAAWKKLESEFDLIHITSQSKNNELLPKNACNKHHNESTKLDSTNEDLNVQLQTSMESYSDILDKENSCMKNTSLCKRCKRCQGSISDDMESFAFPSMLPFPSLPFDRLEKLRTYPNIEDVHEYWRRRSLEKKGSFHPDHTEHSFYLDGLSSVVNNCQEVVEDLHKTLRQMKELNVLEPLHKDICFKILGGPLSEDLPNWIPNWQMKSKRIVQFSNRKLLSCIIELHYEGQHGNEICIQRVTLHKEYVQPKYWKAIDCLLDSALDISFNVDLKPFGSCITKHLPIFELLKPVDVACNRLIRYGNDLWRLIINKRAALVRHSNRTIVRKILRDVVYDDGAPFVVTTVFEIELRNIFDVSFSDIISPPLYSFCEKVKFLPRGIDFLSVFLEDPCSYLQR